MITRLLHITYCDRSILYSDTRKYTIRFLPLFLVVFRLCDASMHYIRVRQAM